MLKQTQTRDADKVPILTTLVKSEQSQQILSEMSLQERIVKHHVKGHNIKYSLLYVVTAPIS